MKPIKFLYFILFGLIILPQISLAECNFNFLSPINYKEKNDAVKAAQLCLQDLGYNISQATGYFGNETMKAVKSFYSKWYGTWNGLRLGSQGIQNLKKAFSGNSDSTFSMTNFSSEEEYKAFLKNNSENLLGYGTMSLDDLSIIPPRDVVLPAAPTANGSTTKESTTSSDKADRYSSTNTQVLNIDEPDISKTNGQTIFYSNHSSGGGAVSCVGEGERAMCGQVYNPKSQISLINALPINNLSIDSTIPSNTAYSANELLLDKNILIVFQDKAIKGYDVSNTKEPKEKWTITLDSNTQVSDARLKEGKIYLITKSYTSSYKTCPITILKYGEVDLTVPCNNIYHPSSGVAVDSNYAVMSVNPEDGKILNNISFLGSSSSQLYVSDNNLYVAYALSGDQISYYLNFLKEKATDLFPSSLIEQVEKVSKYDISNSSKINELKNEINKFYTSLSNNEALRIRTEFTNRAADYSKAHTRDWEKTAIVKIGLSDLKVNNTSTIPGTLLNQFSLDEYNGKLRVATTIGGQWNIFGVRSESDNDIYVLDEHLSVVGSVLNLGTTEKIYSARFIGNRGYLVTFRQTDPFYVLDLSNPSAPSLKGELKIPGYSAYLHPITDNTILGIGKENNKVKLSLFDVTSPENPTEISKYNLDDYWTEIESNHHAFLLDKIHNIFFIPASQGGYIFSYKDNKLSLVKAVQGSGVKRAIYINDYLYMLTENKVIVLDENTWNTVKELTIEVEK